LCLSHSNTPPSGLSKLTIRGQAMIRAMLCGALFGGNEMRFGHSNALPLAESAGRLRSSYTNLSYCSGSLLGGNKICFGFSNTPPDPGLSVGGPFVVTLQ
jgi:hypothetical protein